MCFKITLRNINDGLAQDSFIRGPMNDIGTQL
jgi:hypothetical protein